MDCCHFASSLVTHTHSVLYSKQGVVYTSVSVQTCIRYHSNKQTHTSFTSRLWFFKLQIFGLFLAGFALSVLPLLSSCSPFFQTGSVEDLWLSSNIVSSCAVVQTVSRISSSSVFVETVSPIRHWCSSFRLKHILSVSSSKLLWSCTTLSLNPLQQRRLSLCRCGLCLYQCRRVTIERRTLGARIKRKPVISSEHLLSTSYKVGYIVGWGGAVIQSCQI